LECLTRLDADTAELIDHHSVAVQEWFRLNGPIQHLEEAEVVRDGCIERRAADVDPGRLGRIVGPGEWVELDLPGCPMEAVYGQAVLGCCDRAGESEIGRPGLRRLQPVRYLR
jgi:hypothetical protein